MSSPLIRSALLIVTVLATAPALGAQSSPETTVGAGTQPTQAPRAADSVERARTLTGVPHSNRGAAITVIEASPDFRQAPSFPSALQARVPGLSVNQGEGFVGSTSRLWLRGPSSFLVNQPLIIIDGIRAHAAQRYEAYESNPMPSRLEGIDPETVERVEVLPGIVSSAIYGPGASKGVILVTTKRGSPGPARWQGFAESGPMIEATRYPANFETRGVSTIDESPVGNCFLEAQAAGRCIPVERVSWNPLEGASPFRTGWSHGGGLTVGGSRGAVVYHGAVNHERLAGVYDRDHGQSTNGRINITSPLSSTADVRFIAGYRREQFNHPTTDYITAGMRGAAVDDPVLRGYRFTSPAAIEVGRQVDDGSRANLALSGTWRARGWLHTSANIGYDRLAAVETFRLRTPEGGFGSPPSTDSVTRIDRIRDVPEAVTAGIEAVVSPGSRHRHRTVVGLQYIREKDRTRTSFETSLPWAASYSWRRAKRATAGAYVQQHVTWNDRLFLTGALRGDQVREGSGQHVISSSIDALWVALGTGRRATPGWLDELRFRGGYGHGGDHLISSAVRVTPPSYGGFDPGYYGPGWEETAEQMRGFEAGVDASMLEGRISARTTGYRTHSAKGLVRTRRFPNLPVTPLVFNDARIATSGLETSVDASLLQRDRITWRLGLGVFLQKSDVRRTLGVPYVDGFAQVIGAGEPIGQYHSRRYGYSDANDDGRIARSEVSLVDEASAAKGSPFPDHEILLRNSISLGRRVHLSAVVDHRGGHQLFNETRASACAWTPRCQEQHDISTSLTDQATAVVGLYESANVFLEDATYTKLREVHVGLELPERWAAVGGARTARLTITGRNLFTWTGYRGLDPEIVSREQETFIASGGFYQPPLRSFSARLDLSW